MFKAQKKLVTSHLASKIEIILMFTLVLRYRLEIRLSRYGRKSGQKGPVVSMD